MSPALLMCDVLLWDPQQCLMMPDLMCLIYSFSSRLLASDTLKGVDCQNWYNTCKNYVSAIFCMFSMLVVSSDCLVVSFFGHSLACWSWWFQKKRALENIKFPCFITFWWDELLISQTTPNILKLRHCVRSRKWINGNLGFIWFLVIFSEKLERKCLGNHCYV